MLGRARGVLGGTRARSRRGAPARRPAPRPPRRPRGTATACSPCSSPDSYRSCPSPPSTTASGLTAVGFLPYLVATAVGILPGTVAVRALGAYGSDPGSWPFLVAVGAPRPVLRRPRERPSLRRATTGRGARARRAVRPLLAARSTGSPPGSTGPRVTPDRLTVAGIVLGLAGAGAAAATWWWPRARRCGWCPALADGLDGAWPAVAAHGPACRTPGAGGFLDITGDFAGVRRASSSASAWAPASPSCRSSPCCWRTTSTAPRSSRSRRSPSAPAHRSTTDGRCPSSAVWPRAPRRWSCTRCGASLPFWAPQIAWVWAAVVGVSALQRLVGGYRALARGGEA